MVRPFLAIPAPLPLFRLHLPAIFPGTPPPTSHAAEVLAVRQATLLSRWHGRVPLPENEFLVFEDSTVPT